jgi:hypothetical protein
MQIRTMLALFAMTATAIFLSACSQSPCPPEADQSLCARLGNDCGDLTAIDTCGRPRTVNCGSCSDPMTCGGGGTDNVCGVIFPVDAGVGSSMDASMSACQAESDSSFCARLGKGCGMFSAPDNCGNTRNAHCGDCMAPMTCGGGGNANVCGSPGMMCQPETDAAFCARLGKNCDAVSATDNCGAHRSANCGACSGEMTCGAGGTQNVCGCMPETDGAFCVRYGKDCGTFMTTDNCGAVRSANCGSCLMGMTCGGGGMANVCAMPVKRVFATRAKFLGTFGGIAMGDQICNDAAQAAGIAGAWKAWLSDPQNNAIDRIADVGPWYLMDRMTLVFTGKTALGQAPLVGIDMDEYGAMIAQGNPFLVESAWTGTLQGGHKANTGGYDDCNGWNRASVDGISGSLMDPSTWTDTGSRAHDCSTDNQHLYCFEQ